MQVRARKQVEPFAVELDRQGRPTLYVRPSLVMGPSALAALDALLADLTQTDSGATTVRS